MRFIHIGDLHIGKSLNDYNLIEDQKYILDQIIEIAVSRQADAVLIAGDVYDKAIPSEEAVRLFDDFLQKMAAHNLKVFIISGNHDSDERLGFGSNLFANSEVYIASKFDGSLYKQQLHDEYGPVNVYLLPFVKASVVRHYYPEADITTYDDAVATVIDNAGIDTGMRNIIVAHQYVVGRTEEPSLSGSESIAVRNVGMIERVGTNCFDDFDYVALGHIHGPQRVGRDEIRYAGSPLKYSLSEVDNNKSISVITIGEKGNTIIELVQLKPLRDLRHIKGELKELIKKDNIVSPDDYIYVTLTDEEIINDALGIIRQYYPNTVKIDYDNSHTKADEEVDITEITGDRPFDEIISDFYELMYGTKMSEEEMKLFDEIAKEAGVCNETD